MEQWRTIEVAPDYAVSSLGRIRRETPASRSRVGQIRKTWAVRGYEYVTLRKDGKNKGYQVHRLVAQAFLGASELQVNHINGVRKDNRVENLQYVTGKQNQQHSRDILGTFQMGSKHHAAKLTEDDVRDIRRLYRKGTNGKMLAAAYDVSDALIYMIIQRKWWKHVA